jgi:hypothetical protein
MRLGKIWKKTIVVYFSYYTGTFTPRPAKHRKKDEAPKDRGYEASLGTKVVYLKEISKTLKQVSQDI